MSGESPSPEDLPERSRERYCEEHDLYKFKNARGWFVCPFCARDDGGEDGGA